MKSKSLYLLIAIWIIAVCISFFWNLHFTKKDSNSIVLNKARSFFEQIVVTRSWNASHGGIYVLQNEQNQPNPYLIDSLRDLITTNGIKLTKINPAYMTRQIAEVNEAKSKLKFHITSLNPIRKENKADDWEVNALTNFSKTHPEILEYIKNDTLSQYRYMAPLFTIQSCLQCHAYQGYKIGDIRGGISVSFPSKDFTDSEKRQIKSLIYVHLFLLLFGLLGIYLYFRITKKYFTSLQTKNIELKDKEKQLLSINEQLIHSNNLKNKFFSIIAHDLKNPFNSLIGLSDMLIQEKESMSNDDFNKYLLILSNTSKNSYQLLDNLLKWSQTEMHSIAFNPALIDINPIIHNNIQLVQASIQKKQLNIINSIPYETKAYADINMFDTIIRNLLSNAIKYSNTGGVIEISFENSIDNYTFTVSDFGVGMNLEQIEKLFDIDNQKSTLGTLKERGTGLGLVLCKEFIEMHKGRICIKSELNKGSEFKFTLPKKGF